MGKSWFLIPACLLLFAFAIGCSSGGNTQEPISPFTGDKTPVAASPAGGATLLMGLWQVTVNRETGTIEAVDMRSSSLIINVLSFLEPPALSGMTIDFSTLGIHPATNIVNVDVIVKHPINDPVFTGFDVRGVVFGPEVTNADGLTIIPSPEFFTGVPFGYINGLIGVPDGTANYEGLAGYKYFCKNLGLNDDLAAFMSVPANLANRGVFPIGTTLKRHYDLSWADTTPPITFLVFNYAIYANYNWPTGSPPYDISDFDITATNSAEAFCAKVTETANSLWFSGGGGGGALNLHVEVWDWQGDVNAVGAESVDAGVLAAANGAYAGPGSTAKSGYWDVAWTTANPTAAGDLDILITVTDPRTFGQAWFMGMLPSTHDKYNQKVFNCFVYTTTVSECPQPAVTNINPNSHAADGVSFPATVTGANFVDGASKAVKLKRTGQADIVASSVVISNSTTITCTLNIPAATVTGLWNVEVTNGCGGTPGVGNNLFTVTSTGVTGPKNIDLWAIRGYKATAWDLAVNPKNGDLLILYSDCQMWKHTSADYTQGTYLYDTKMPFTEMPGNGWIDIGINSYFIVGLDKSSLGTNKPPYGAWTHHQSNGIPVATQTSDIYHAFGDVMAANEADQPSYDDDHFSFYGTEITKPPIYSFIGQTFDTAYDPEKTTYRWATSTVPDTSIFSLQVSMVKGLEWALKGERFWAIKQYPTASTGYYAACFRFSSVVDPPQIVANTYYFGTGLRTDADTGFYTAWDITTNDDHRLIVVDVLSTNTLQLKGWDPQGTPCATAGASMPLTGLKGNPGLGTYRLRFDCGEYNDPKNGNLLFILHGDASNGYFLSVYYAAELPAWW